jgi:hypothetical protein
VIWSRHADLRRRLLIGVAAAAVLGAVFAAYLDPHRAVELAGRVWACL